MATPVLTTDLITINACNTVSGWSGDTFVLDPDFKKEGSNCVSCQSTTNGVNRITCSVANVTLGTEHIRFWFASTMTGFYEAGAAALQLEVVHTGGTAIWNIDPTRVYAGGWLNVVIYGGSTIDSGTAIGGNTCSSISIVQNTSSKPRGTLNTFVDYVRYGDGIIATGGTSGDEIDLAGIVAQDIVNGYGVLEVIDGVYFAKGIIQIGNGATTTWFEDLGEVMVFSDQPVLSTLYELIFTGAGCRANILGGLYSSSAAQTFTFSADSLVFDMVGKQVLKSDGISFAAAHSVTGNVFDNCGQIVPLTATFETNTVTNTTSLTGALLLALTNNVDNITFDGNDYDVYIVEAGTYNNVGLKHGTNTTDLRYNNGSTAQFNTPINGDTATVTNDSAAMTVVAGQKTFSFTLNPSITGYEWRMYTVTAIDSMDGAVEIVGEESAIADNQSHAHGYTNQPFALQIISANYEEVLLYYTLNATDLPVTIPLKLDTNK
jgi:hypothetical protein